MLTLEAGSVLGCGWRRITMSGKLNCEADSLGYRAKVYRTDIPKDFRLTHELKDAEKLDKPAELFS